MDENASKQELYEDALARRNEWRALVESAGWKRLCEVAGGQVAARVDINGRSRSKGLEDVFEREFSAGEVSGIELFMRIPATVVEQLEEEVQSLFEDMQNDA
jgi:hypothetical protein